MIREQFQTDTEEDFPFEQGHEGLGRVSVTWQDGTRADD